MKISFLMFFLLLLSSCATQDTLKNEKAGNLNINQEFEKMVEVKPIPVSAEKVEREEYKDLPQIKPLPTKVAKKKEIKKREIRKKSVKRVIKVKEMDKVRKPELENSEGFEGRRPIADPFVVGEKVTFSMTYFNMSAGDMTLAVKPFVEVNGSKSYHFEVAVKSSKVFSYFYAVDDRAETFMDFETMRPSSYSIHVKESKQLKEVRSFFDWNTLEATYWQKRITEEKGEESKRKNWKIKDYSQNVISAIFYLRTFSLREGKDLAFRVSDAGSNMVFTGKVIRKEKIKTQIGAFDTIVVKPKIEVDGVFKQMGDIFIWFTDDERKLPVRIEAKIKIGTLVAKLKKLKK